MSGQNKRYFWLKLKDDFFSQKEIKMLRRIAGGDTYTIIYLKMLLLSLKNDGKIYFDGIADNFVEEIALDIDEDVENTHITFNYLKQKGLIEFDDHELEMSNIASMIGSETESARRVRKHREQKALQSNTNVTTKKQLGNTEKEIETELELEKDIDIEKDKETDTEKERVGVVFDKYTELGFGAINAFKAEQLSEWLKTFEHEVVVKSLEVASNNNKATMNYVNGILNNWKQRGLTTMEKVEAEEKRKQVEQMKPSYQQRRREKPGEVTPSWMKVEKKEEAASGPAKTAGEDPEIQKMIAEFRNGG
ncbi:phage replisome organizer N-terminal domain-containing protein [Salinicoccus roseus]|uniref:Phage replisome organizer N-terminal domain-containing protein n=1 Tax=Salinicoccus roseus TaxID=45670 RepID=A0ABT4YKH0_9STAP|nr:phage replisome organizer N-terminal domain-containing protein [Salinicoccus roseus]MDB0581212.1 phage replisome organizer N-terminal domain-containing protein [Salinicoccus roseus]